MDLINICETYIKHKPESLNEQELKNCVTFHLYEEVKKRAKFDERFSQLIELIKNQDSRTCPKAYSDISLCEYSDILLSYACVVALEFEKEIKNNDFSDFKIVYYYFFEKFGIEMSKIEKLFKINQ